MVYYNEYLKQNINKISSTKIEDAIYIFNLKWLIQIII